MLLHHEDIIYYILLASIERQNYDLRVSIDMIFPRFETLYIQHVVSTTCSKHHRIGSVDET